MTKSVLPGLVEIDVMARYMEQSGITGTVGAAKNIGQAGGGAGDVVKILTPKPQVRVPGFNQQAGWTGAYAVLAVVTKLSPAIYEDVLKAAALAREWERILFEWEQKLLVGEYNVYRCVDHGHLTSPGNFLLTLGIATEESYLKRFKDDILGSDLEISLWKKIKGNAPWPKPGSPVSPIPRFPTIKQGCR